MKHFVWGVLLLLFVGQPFRPVFSVSDARDARGQGTDGWIGGPSAPSTTHCSARRGQLCLQLWDPRRRLPWLGPAVSFVKPRGYMTASSSHSA